MSTKELTQEEINCNKMLDAMALHNKTEDSGDKKNTDKPVEEYRAELSDMLDKVNTEDSREEALSKEEQDTLEMMSAYMEHHMGPAEYVVRGAWLHCEYGSHHRKLNLPTCHGVYIGENPVMNSMDYKAGLGDEGVDKHTINIPSFGVCKAPKSGDIGERNISLAAEVLGVDGLPTMSESGTRGKSDGGVVTGERCKACFLDSNGEMSAWQNTHNRTKIGGEQYFALTTNSFLACKYGGIIRVVTSGQEHIMSESDYADRQVRDDSMGYTDMMDSNYGFSSEESATILKAYGLLLEEAKNKGFANQKKIHFIFSKLSSLCDNYDGETFRWRMSGDIPPTEDTKSYLKSLGMSEKEVEYLDKTINRQHDNPAEKDFAHELVQYAIFADDSFVHNLMDGSIGKMNALGSYKGDVYSTRMDIDDMNSDVDATNIYNRMMGNNEDPFETILKYNLEVEQGETNRVDEFLSFYGNGNINAGLEYIKKDLMIVDMGAHYIGGTYGGIKGFIKENIQDALFKNAMIESLVGLQGEDTFNKVMGKTNANDVFEESQQRKDIGDEEYNILETMDQFVNYLENGMSK